MYGLFWFLVCLIASRGGCVWDYMPTPGVLTVALALFAAVFAKPPVNHRVEEKSWLQWTCISVIFLLAAGEIFIIRHDREVQDDKHLGELRDERDRFAQQMDFLTHFHGSIESRLDKASELLSRAKAQPVPNALKVEALQLVKDIFQFSGERDKQQPAYSISNAPEARQEESEAFDRWRNKTVGDYQAQFDARITGVSQRMKAKGIDPSHLEFSCLRPVNTQSIPMCADELQALASKLP